LPQYGLKLRQKYLFHCPRTNSGGTRSFNKKLGTEYLPEFTEPVLGTKTLVFAKTCPKRSFSIQSETIPEFIDPRFRENKPKTLVFSHSKRAFWACFRETVAQETPVSACFG
jgi:hypothetical protein